MIFTCPTCSIDINVKRFPVECCRVAHNERSPAIREGEIVKAKRKKVIAPANDLLAPCKWRSKESRRHWCDPCNKFLLIYDCDHFGCECAIGKTIDGIRSCNGCEEKAPPLIEREPSEWISTAQLVTNTELLIEKLPHDITAIAGVTRSGMLPASIAAMRLHLPLYEMNPAVGLRELSSGWRLNAKAIDRHKFAIIDDTVATGLAMTKTIAALPDIYYVTGVVYASPEHSHIVNYFAKLLPIPHYLEWNIFNSVHSKNMAFDFDGVICEECPTDCDDDGPKYIEWLTNAKPLHLPRKYPVRLIVTARLEKYRAATLDWLARHNVHVETLVMGQWESLGVRREDYDAGRYKGGQYNKSMCDLFVESCPLQSEQIAAASGKRVICPSAGRIWN